jgi:hypothetical protein
MLHNHVNIKRFIAGIFLLLFAFSIMPRNVLHDLFANHIDKTTLSKKSNTSQVKTFDYLCKCDNLVVESPFIETVPHFDFSINAPFAQHLILTSYYFNSIQYFFFEHRGPPATV